MLGISPHLQAMPQRGHDVVHGYPAAHNQTLRIAEIFHAQRLFIMWPYLCSRQRGSGGAGIV